MNAYKFVRIQYIYVFLSLTVLSWGDASMLLADISKIRRKHLIDGVHFSGDGYAKVPGGRKSFNQFQTFRLDPLCGKVA